MREITTHAVNGLNDALTLHAVDEPGQGNAHHAYRVGYIDSENVQHTCDVTFQNGPIAEHGVNGISNEVLLAIVQDRLECFQTGPYACDTNQAALEHVREAMASLHSRTQERVKRGVEGTHQV